MGKSKLCNFQGATTPRGLVSVAPWSDYIIAY
nr:MAG TPA: hypothetical protein [Caudoviricetes sp.]